MGFMMLIKAGKKEVIQLTTNKKTTSTTRKKKETRPTKTCSNPECGKTTVSIDRAFYETTDLKMFPDGRLPLCKECIYAEWEEEGFEAFARTMRYMNKPIVEEHFKGDYKEYMKLIASVPWAKSMTFMDSTMFSEKKTIMAERRNRVQAKELDQEELEYLQYFFGAFKEATEADYIFLKDEYDDYFAKHDLKENKANENLIKHICVKTLEIRKAQQQGVKTDTMQKTLQDLLGAAQLKPNQNSDSMLNDTKTLGTMIRDWEVTKPVPDVPEHFKKNDWVKKNLEVWFTGHLMKMMGKALNPILEKQYEEELAKFSIQKDNADEFLDDEDGYDV